MPRIFLRFLFFFFWLLLCCHEGAKNIKTSSIFLFFCCVLFAPPSPRIALISFLLPFFGINFFFPKKTPHNIIFLFSCVCCIQPSLTAKATVTVHKKFPSPPNLSTFCRKKRKNMDSVERNKNQPNIKMCLILGTEEERAGKIHASKKIPKNIKKMPAGDLRKDYIWNKYMRMWECSLSRGQSLLCAKMCHISFPFNYFFFVRAFSVPWGFSFCSYFTFFLLFILYQQSCSSFPYPTPLFSHFPCDNEPKYKKKWI